MDNINKLRDIKSIIYHNHIWSFIECCIVIILCLIAFYLLIIWLYKFLNKIKQPIYTFDLSNSKHTAYKLIDIIRSQPNSQKYIDILHDKYTYKKNVPPFDKKLFDEIVEVFNIKIKL